MLHAVIVGVDEYDDAEIPPLSCARRDAETLAGLLSSRIKQDELRMKVLVDKKATRSNVVSAIGEDLPRAVGHDDIVLLYFACHGSPEKELPPDDVSMYLVLHDTDYRRIYSTGIDMERDVLRWMERLRKPKLVLLLLDACFSGRAGGRTLEGPILKASRKEPGYRGDDDRISLKDLDLGKGRAIIAGADDTQVALEDTSLGHGVFTYHVLKTLRATRHGARTIPVADLYREVDQAVRLATGGIQEPVFNGRLVHGSFPLLG
jgi:uncharacterized caspase-like protein